MAKWIENLTTWLNATGPHAAPTPDLDGAPERLAQAVQELAERLGNAPQLIDAARFEELNSLGDPTLVRQISQTFFGGVSSQLGALRQAIEAKDEATIRSVAHTIKGGAASAGFPLASDAAAALEEAARLMQRHAYSKLMTDLETGIERTREKVEAQFG